jgi:hypothetical protein
MQEAFDKFKSDNERINHINQPINNKKQAVGEKKQQGEILSRKKSTRSDKKQ